MTTVELDLATTLARLIRFTDAADRERAVVVDCKTVGSDPATSATLSVAAADGVVGPLTCHVLFPEVSFTTVPVSVALDAQVVAGEVTFVMDSADESGPCIAVPFGHNLKPGHPELKLEVDTRPFMVWKEKRKRAMVPPVRFKYLLIISPHGQPFTVTLSRLRFQLA
jgi:hypothetical protein